MVRQIWEVDYYAEILDLKEKNRKLEERMDWIKKYLDDSIRHWRKIYNDQTIPTTPPDDFEREMAEHYIDAYQSVRSSIFGEVLE